MITNEAQMSDFVNSQTQLLCELWEKCGNKEFDLPISYSFDEKLHNESKISETLSWLDRTMENPIRDASYKEEVRAEAFERVKTIGSEIFHCSRDDFNCLEDLGIGKSLTLFIQQARSFDPWMSDEDIYQASRNVWTGNYLQALLGLQVELTPALFGYSMLYPVSDNYLDNPNLGRAEKIEFNHRFSNWLSGESDRPGCWSETDVFDLVKMIESQFPRRTYPQVYAGLLAIHHAQDKSMRVQHLSRNNDLSDTARISFEKGGTSVLADGILASGELPEEMMKIFFNYGAFAQLMDDQEDVETDLKCRSLTLFTGEAVKGKLDHLLQKYLYFANEILKGLERFNSEQTKPLKTLSLSGINLLLIDAMTRTSKFYSDEFQARLEVYFPVRFRYLKQVRKEIRKKQLDLNHLAWLLPVKAVA